IARKRNKCNEICKKLLLTNTIRCISTKVCETAAPCEGNPAKALDKGAHHARINQSLDPFSYSRSDRRVMAVGRRTGFGGRHGGDLASLQGLIGDPAGTAPNSLCQLLGMNQAPTNPDGTPNTNPSTTKPYPCPQLPTITQAVLQLAALGNTLSEMARAQNDV